MRILAIIGAGVLLLSSSFCFTARTSTMWMDSVSGSSKVQGTYFGIEAAPTIRVSSLESWLRKREPRFTNQGKYVAMTEYDLWGGLRLIADGRAPEIFSLHGELMDEVLKLSTDAEIEYLVTELRSNDRKRQEDAVDAAELRYIRHITK